MSGAYWLKLYHEARIDRKLMLLNDAQFRVWVNLLLYSSEQEERGTIANKPRPLIALETSLGNVPLLNETLDLLVALDMINVDGDKITFTKFKKRQETKPSELPEARRERKRKSREKQRDTTLEQSMSRESRDMSRESRDMSRDVTTPVTQSRVEKSFGLLRNPLPFGSDVENDDTPDDPPPPKTRKPRKKKDEASTVHEDVVQRKENPVWDLYQAFCDASGTAPLPKGQLLNAELKFASNLLGAGATTDDVKREYGWLHSQPWLQSGVDMKLMSTKFAAWVAEKKPDTFRARFIGRKDIGLTDDELLQRINQGANGHDDAGRNDESVIDVSGRVVNGADHGSENRGLSRSPFSR